MLINARTPIARFRIGCFIVSFITLLYSTSVLRRIFGRRRWIVFACYEEIATNLFILFSVVRRMMIALVEADHHNVIHIDSMGLDGEMRRHVISNSLKGQCLMI